MSEEKYSGYVGYCKCGSLVMGVLGTTDAKASADVLYAIKSGLQVKYVRDVPAQVLEPCKCKQVPQQNTPQLSDARKDLLRLRDGLEALYNYKDWKIKKQEIRAKNVLRALGEYEKLSTSLEEKVKELEAEKKFVNLDEIFPPEIMEKAARFIFRNPVDNAIVQIWQTYSLPKGCICLLNIKDLHEWDGVIVAEGFDYEKAEYEELARVRVRLGLTVEIVEKEASNVD